MIDYPNAILTDSLERELLRRELDYYNDAPLLSLFGWVASGAKAVQSKVVSFVAGVSSDMDAARQEGHKVTAA